MIKRKEHYIEHPQTFGVCCNKCKGSNIYWSEFEEHIWCFECKEDVYYKPGFQIFPVQTALMMGITFDKINLETGEGIEFKMDER